MKRFVRIIIDAFFRIFYQLEVRGLETLTQEPVILAPNHNHLLDPLLLAAIYRPDLTAVAKKELSDIGWIRWIFGPLDVISIDREGRDLKSIRQSVEILDRMSLIVFPEGTRNDSQTTPLPGKPGVPLMARQAKVAIVPVVLHGNYRPFSKLIVEFMPGLTVESFGYRRLNSESYQAIADEILNRIYQRKGELIDENHHR
ncbi:MAG TPA: 1-acyl-sn-glycerol-3-phosphate acyltransferase [Tissierellia bacterium]|nr:1-acyl-sn-glycerol-3-phosphate acyltransferase [Tissierellia bacterium]